MSLPLAWNPDDPASQRERFLMELEFVQCLANPGYVGHLAATRVLYEPAFVGYLEYLQYWRRPEYARFLAWPTALRFLELLQKEEFRQSLLEPGVVEKVARQLELHWQYWRANQLMERDEAKGDEEANVADGAVKEEA